MIYCWINSFHGKVANLLANGKSHICYFHIQFLCFSITFLSLLLTPGSGGNDVGSNSKVADSKPFLASLCYSNNSSVLATEAADVVHLTYLWLTCLPPLNEAQPFALHVKRSCVGPEMALKFNSLWWVNHNHNHECYSALSTSMKTDSALQCR